MNIQDKSEFTLTTAHLNQSNQTLTTTHWTTHQLLQQNKKKKKTEKSLTTPNYQQLNITPKKKKKRENRPQFCPGQLSAQAEKQLLQPHWMKPLNTQAKPLHNLFNLALLTQTHQINIWWVTLIFIVKLITVHLLHIGVVLLPVTLWLWRRFRVGFVLSVGAFVVRDATTVAAIGLWVVGIA